MTEGDRNGSRHAEDLAACFTVHARDLFGYACALSGGNRALAGLIRPVRVPGGGHGLVHVKRPARRSVPRLVAGHAGQHGPAPGRPTRQARRSPPRRTGGSGVTVARFRTDYDAVAALDRFAGWLRDRAAGDGEPGRARGGSGDRPDEPSTVSPATPPDAGGQDRPEGAGPGPDGPAQQPVPRLAGRWGIRPASLGALSAGANAARTAARRTAPPAAAPRTGLPPTGARPTAPSPAGPTGTAPRRTAARSVRKEPGSRTARELR